jgi:hypothetical protein
MSSFLLMISGPPIGPLGSLTALRDFTGGPAGAILNSQVLCRSTPIPDTRKKNSPKYGYPLDWRSYYM